MSWQMSSKDLSEIQQENTPELANELTALIMEMVHPKAGESLTGETQEEAPDAAK